MEMYVIITLVAIGLVILADVYLCIEHYTIYYRIHYFSDAV